MWRASRRQLLKTAVPLIAAAQTRKRPNILLIVLDDLGCRDLGFLGASDLRTPHIDRLARDGVVFTNWYSNAPICGPARASILSGRYPVRAGVSANLDRLTPGIPTLAGMFRGAGYQTAAIGKWHLGSDDQSCPNAHGFNYFYGFHAGCIDYYSHRFYWGEPNRVNFHDLWRNRTEIFEDGQYFTDRIAAETVDFLNRSKGTPFCGYFAFNAPHYPMHAPQKYIQRFASLPEERRTYAAMISAVDDAVGGILTALENNGQLDNTLLFLVGDNGATTEKRAGLRGGYATAGSNGPFRGYKFSLFDGGLHVPAVVHWPARLKPGVRDQQVQSMDILPTAMAAAGLVPPDGLDGCSVLPVLLDDTASPHAQLLWESHGQLAVRRGDWKLVLNGRTYDRSSEGVQPLTGDDAAFLSNLSADQGESENLRRTDPALLDELMTIARKWQSAVHE